jgi:hypothetical protein
MLIAHAPGQQEHLARAPWYAGMPLAAIMLAMVAAGVIAAYDYGLLDSAAQNIMYFAARYHARIAAQFAIGDRAAASAQAMLCDGAPRARATGRNGKLR